MTTLNADVEAARAELRELGAIMVDDIIGPGEIRDLAGGVTRVSFKRWRDGERLRGAGPFPQPFKTVSGVDLFDRAAVNAWLEKHRAPH